MSVTISLAVDPGVTISDRPDYVVHDGHVYAPSMHDGFYHRSLHFLCDKCRGEAPDTAVDDEACIGCMEPATKILVLPPTNRLEVLKDRIVMAEVLNGIVKVDSDGQAAAAALADVITTWRSYDPSFANRFTVDFPADIQAAANELNRVARRIKDPERLKAAFGLIFPGQPYPE